MSRYFIKFPKLIYTKDSISSIVTNLLTRIGVVKGTLDTISLYYEYVIQEGDTPEIVSSKYYNDPELHWIILMFNDMYDPFYDWPMAYQQFVTFIIDKYGSIETAKTTLHHYEKSISTVDNVTGTSTTNTYTIDETSYNQLVPSSVVKTFDNGQSVTINISKREVDSYTYEDELNESKRKIKLIKAELVPEVKRQFEILMGE